MEQNLLTVKGRIFNIQRFSIHDGPGVRTIVFLKGCPLRCRWCCNPESQEWEFQTMVTDGVAKPVGRDVTVGEVIEEIERDRMYYRRSGGGGLTLSGGECLWQPDFSEALLKVAHGRGITTAIETTGYAEMSTVRRLLPYVDTVLMDIKHMNGEKHKEFTTKDNGLILDNARMMAKEANRLIVRTPVIPTVNDTEDEIRAIAEFARSIGVKEMHLLPYHRIGSDKYKGLGRAYTMAHIEPPPASQMERLLSVVKGVGLTAQIGG